MEVCDKGWPKSGDCCCNCAHQIRLYKHPWNPIYKGCISEPTDLYACIIEHHIEKNNKGIVYEFEHGYCELYQRKTK